MVAAAVTETLLEAALAHVVSELKRLNQPFALVGGIAVSIRAEVRFTRDVDLAIAVEGDARVEALVRELRGVGYEVAALVEHESQKRLATVRLASPSGYVVDLIAASCGIEPEVVERATPIAFTGSGDLRVARAEELLAMKILSMTDRRPQDRMDATNLVLVNETLDLPAVRDNLNLITDRGFHRNQDLAAKLAALLEDIARG